MGICQTHTLWIVFSMLLLLRHHYCLSVHFHCQKPRYVTLGRSLDLQVQIANDPGEKVVMVTWEREAEGGSKQRIAEIPRQNSNPHVKLELDGKKLKVRELRREDLGEYMVTATNALGHQKSDRCVVKEAVTPQVSVSLLCDVDNKIELWDVPTFQWLVDGVVAPSHNLSENGSRLHLSQLRGSNYTCVVTNNQGSSLSHHIAGATPSQCDLSTCIIWKSVAIALLLMVVFSSLVFIFIKNRHMFRHICIFMSDHRLS